MSIPSHVRPLVLLIPIVTLSGCVTAQFEEPIGKFTTAMATANGVVADYFTGMNDFERELYLRRALHDPTLSVAAIDARGSPTGLLPVFSAESIKARLDAISLLSAYGERLAALAGAEGPTQFNQNVATLGQNLGTLNTTFAGLAGRNDPTANKYIAPIGTIIGTLGEMYLASKRDAAVTKAVNEGAPAVNAILDQLDNDLQRVVQPLEVTGALQELSGEITAYNANRSTMTYEQRTAALDRIDVLAGKYNAAVTSNPTEAIDGIRDAHAALVKYANSPRKPTDLASLNSAIENFNNRLRPIADSLKQLKGMS